MKRAALIEEARKILDAAEAEGRSLTAEDRSNGIASWLMLTR